MFLHVPFLLTSASWCVACLLLTASMFLHDCVLLTLLMNTYFREFHNKVPREKMSLLCRKFCVINKPFTENIVYFVACKTYAYPKK